MLIWKSKLLRALFSVVDSAIASGNNEQLYQFWILDFGFWIESLDCKAVSVISNNTTYPNLVLALALNSITHLSCTSP
ncbi:hypothetical protein CEN40_04160 [Fischerella thermalis CCMEE 5205]|uniref:hypothetical protein n=1 Tax=Fischerella thermalis TaxID=372787 RepID=UPI000C7F957D|nr:hypothetical protein CEN40_04160 [Fischerella thermalis CCMEE 5205]